MMTRLGGAFRVMVEGLREADPLGREREVAALQAAGRAAAGGLGRDAQERRAVRRELVEARMRAVPLEQGELARVERAPLVVAEGAGDLEHALVARGEEALEVELRARDEPARRAVRSRKVEQASSYCRHQRER